MGTEVTGADRPCTGRAGRTVGLAHGCTSAAGRGRRLHPRGDDIALERGGFHVTACGDGRGRWTFVSGPFDLVLLDVMLPAPTGSRCCAESAQAMPTPIVMLTAPLRDPRRGRRARAGRGRLPDQALRTGGAGGEGAGGAAAGESSPGTRGGRRFGELKIDKAALPAPAATAHDLGLTATEFKLLCEAGRSRDRCSHATCCSIWSGYEFLGDSRLVDVAVQRLRAKSSRPRAAGADQDRPRRRLPVRARAAPPASRSGGCGDGLAIAFVLVTGVCDRGVGGGVCTGRALLCGWTNSPSARSASPGGSRLRLRPAQPSVSQLASR